MSNFYPHHLQGLMAQCEIVPMVNQVELHPLLQLGELREFCAQYHIQIEAWAPIMRGQVNRVPALVEIAREYNKTPVQIALRWAYQHNIIVIPKSQSPDRIKSNARIFDFELDSKAMTKIDALDRSFRLGPHPDNFAY